MKRITVLFVVFFTAITASALAATEPAEENDMDKPAEKVQASPSTGDDSREEINGSTGWPRPFVPSEKIGADSVVSFPADI
jgi:hypothetical protein